MHHESCPLRSHRRRTAIPVAWLLALAPLAHGQIEGLYGINQASGTLHLISPTTAASTQIASTGITGLRSLELASDGFLYAFTASSTAQLYRINPATGAATMIGPLGFSFVFEGALAFSPDGVAYGANSGSASVPGLFQIDLTTGAGTLIGILPGSTHDLNGLAWRDDGRLIGLDRPTNALIEIDPQTVAVTTIAPLVPNVGGAGGMAVLGGRGYFTVANALWTFDLFTGAHSLVGPTSVAFDAGISGDARLQGDALLASLSAGSVQTLSLAAPHHANQIYLVAGTTAGVFPGIDLGNLLVPLTFDGLQGYLLYSLNFPNTIPLVGSLGVLSSSGLATAQIVVPAGTNPGIAGVRLHHAFAVVDGSGTIRTVSNPVPLALIP